MKQLISIFCYTFSMRFKLYLKGVIIFLSILIGLTYLNPSSVVWAGCGWNAETGSCGSCSCVGCGTCTCVENGPGSCSTDTSGCYSCGGGGGGNPTATPLPYATATIPVPSNTPFPTSINITQNPLTPTPIYNLCGNGTYCNYGYYCCLSGTACCPVGSLSPTGNGGPTATPTPIPVPNCMNLSGPSTLTAGQKGTYTADFSSPQGNLSGEIFAGQNGTGVWYPGNKAISGNSGSLSFDWTPTAAGTYDVLCRAWNDAIAECRGKADYVSGPPVYTCAGPNSSMVVTVVAPTATPTPTPGPWIKLKNTSFYSGNGLTDLIPLVPTAYDADDDSNPYFITGGTGAGLTAASSLNLTAINQSAKPNGSNWSASSYSPTVTFTPASFLKYVKTRKTYTTITDLNDIVSIDHDGIYFYNGSSPVTIDTTQTITDYNTVLITSGEVDINSDFNPTKSIAIVADRISFGSGMNQAKGIFIANTVTVANSTNGGGLKIIGNLVAQTGLTDSRTPADLFQPTIFSSQRGRVFILL